ncbi:hypothetical protein, variant [Saprolegnia diclina VS20]|uniref:Uncharacterized protein n=1 Tax=Saprolegnia diclina (strain VS20) TaxID=1156394 RepID=T0QE85_SAPDV|nr:hypothetical protein SDRG_06322 [Saprolegnia diclina VS20]XP_008610320.1 hypothetical protein, variant [Saprolegnia diclina VS20]EQC36213.1 hypothetical protein SDRG_06322 [Saprolegnia diclina VS20]EQC36214.1 hypothetical protein, variant [Saprolegnia diclina VS20]|eukprot:XP_008610319.1 hypothetical protein SDRG_06322 [Saprolegnia diclina VS20]
MSRKQKRSIVQSQHDLEVRRAKEAKEKLLKKREHRIAKQKKTVEKKVSSKVARRIKARQEKEGVKDEDENAMDEA